MHSDELTRPSIVSFPVTQRYSVLSAHAENHADVGESIVTTETVDTGPWPWRCGDCESEEAKACNLCTGVKAYSPHAEMESIPGCLENDACPQDSKDFCTANDAMPEPNPDDLTATVRELALGRTAPTSKKCSKWAKVCRNRGNILPKL